MNRSGQGMKLRSIIEPENELITFAEKMGRIRR